MIDGARELCSFRCIFAVYLLKQLLYDVLDNENKFFILEISIFAKYI